MGRFRDKETGEVVQAEQFCTYTHIIKHGDGREDFFPSDKFPARFEPVQQPQPGSE